MRLFTKSCVSQILDIDFFAICILQVCYAILYVLNVH